MSHGYAFTHIPLIGQFLEEPEEMCDPIIEGIGFWVVRDTKLFGEDTMSIVLERMVPKGAEPFDDMLKRYGDWDEESRSWDPSAPDGTKL
jgi:hypothetical protein